MKRNILKVLFLFCCSIFMFSEQDRKLQLEQTVTENAKNKIDFVFQQGHIEDISVMEFSSDGKWLVSSDLNCIKIWNVATGRVLQTIFVESIKKCSINNNGTLVAYEYFTGYSSTRLMLYDVLSKNHIELGSPENYSSQLKFSHSGKLLLAGTDIWDIASKKKLGKLEESSSCAVWSNDDKRIIAVGGNGTYEYSVPDGKQLKCIDVLGESYRSAVATNPAGTYIAYTSGQNKLKVIDTKNYTVVSEIPYGYNYSVQTLSFDVSDNISLGENGTVDMWTGNKVRVLGGLYSSNGKTLAVSNKKGAILFYDMPFTVENGKLAEKLDSIVYTSFYTKGDTVLVATEKGFTYLFDIIEQKIRLLPNAKNSRKAYGQDIRAYSKDGKYIACRNRKDNICLIDTKSNKVLYTFPDTEKFICTVSFTEDSENFYAASDKQLRIWNVKTGRLVKEIKCYGKQGVFGKVHLSNDFARIINLASSDFRKKLEILDENGKFVKNVTISDVSNFCICEKDNSIIVKLHSGLAVYDAMNYKLRKKINKFDGWGDCIDVSPDGNIIAVGGIGDVSFYDKESLTKINSIENLEKSYGDKDFYFSSEGKYLITMTNQAVQLWNVHDCTLVTTTMFAQDGEWISYTSNGYFSGTKWATENLVHLVRGMEILGIEQFSESLFRPDLIAAKLRGEDITKQDNFISLNDVVSTGTAPLVSFGSNPSSSSNRDITVNFSVQDQGGGIGSVYLKLNDKVIQLADGSRKLELVGGAANTEQKSSGKTIQFSHLLTLQNGENTIEAYATNSAGKIESRHAATKITWQGKTAKPNLYVLAVGVNKYRDKQLWLNYAVPDASSIADSFKNVKGNLYQSVNVTTIFDADVTSAGLSAAFNLLANKVSADDVFIFYLSGHGTTHTDGDYYFIPVDFRFRNAQSVPESAISKHFITENLSKIRAQKTLVMLDTCNSGAFISTGARGMAEKTAIDRLSRATGQATIAASSDSQSAMEGYEGHGIFTYVILEGLAGKADSNKDGFISLSELSAYAEEKVPDYSYAKWGYEQYPQIDLRKQSNFPLVGK